MVSARVEYNSSFSDSKYFCSVVKIIATEDTEKRVSEINHIPTATSKK